MKRPAVLCRRGLLALVILFGCAWGAVYLDQWILRWQAEKLLVEIQSLQVNRSTSSDVQPILARWKSLGKTGEDCASDGCAYGVTFWHDLPQPLRGYPDNGV